MLPNPFAFTDRAAPVPRRVVRALGLCACIGVLSACGDARTPDPQTPARSFSSMRSTGDVETGFRRAKTVALSRHDDVLLLTLSEPWKGARTPLHYVLGAPPALKIVDTLPLAEDVQPVAVPARRIVVLGAVHTGFLAALAVEDRIVAVDARHHVYSEAVRAAIDAGDVVEVGSGTGLNVERVLAMRPDLVLANAVGTSEYAAYARLRRAGIPVVVTAEWMEDHPLARAEWIRVTGWLVGEGARADSVFSAVESAYLGTAERARGFARRPRVLLGGPYRDQWFVAGGRSFMARLIADAGGDYVWQADTTRGGVPLTLEAVLAAARDADVWLHPGIWKTLSDGLRQDARFRSFSPFRRGDVYNSDARAHADGGNDYWESGTVRPDRILRDLVNIFHAMDDSLFYYRRIPP